MNIAIIPARAGSQRIKNKNIREFLGAPIIGHVIQTLKASSCIDLVYVSTDCENIATIASSFGARIRGLRPADLSGHHVGSSQVVKYEASELLASGLEIDNIAEVYATAALMSTESLRVAFDKVDKLGEGFYVFAACEFASPIERSFKIVDGRCDPVKASFFNTRTQDLPPSFHDAGQFYVAKAATWMTQPFRFDDRSYPIRIPRYRGVDIDWEEDWVMAEALGKSLLGG